MKEKEWVTISVLNYLDSKGLMVFQMPETEKAEIYLSFSDYLKNPFPYSANHTHYIMRGGDVVHIGNQYTCERFRV